jgi:uncharacterized protein YwgA/O-acetyl-ADP-ribose deacetylase (regulator of RNase III)
MMTVRTGDIFSSGAQTLVNTVNCVGVMGKGLALEFRNRFPDMFEDYVHRCSAGLVKLGQPYLFKRVIPPWILNFPTKGHWRAVSRVDDIVQGLRHLKAHYKEWGITSIAVPPLGCGQGQLEWQFAGPVLYSHLREFDIPVELYAPVGTPDQELTESFLTRQPVQEPAYAPSAESKLGSAWIAVVEVLRRIEEEPYHWPVGRTTFQKIAYFVTESGLPTGLRYQRGSYGPYAPELKERITLLVNNGLVREEQLGRMFSVKVGPAVEGARQARSAQLEQWAGAIEKITDLFVRMNTSQAEIAATVHFAAKELKVRSKQEPTEKDVFDEVMQWKIRRRPPLDEKEVASAIRHLNMLSWIGVKVSEELPIGEEELLGV